MAIIKRFSKFESVYNRALSDIRVFAREIMGMSPTWQQDQLFDLVQYETFAPVHLLKKGIAVKSGQGPGKSAATTVVALWRLLRRPGNMVLVTAPTMRQVEDVWIGRLQEWVSKAPVELQQLLDIQKKRVLVNDMQDWRILTATGVKADNVSGYHHPEMTVIADEASGIKRLIWSALKGTLTQERNLLVAIGNPNLRETEFFDMFNKDSHLYHTLTWDSRRSPNVDKRHIKKMADEFGEDSDVYRVRVMGEFPRESPNVVIRYEDLLRACRETAFLKAFQVEIPEDGGPRKQIGIDLARFGSDESVIVARYNCAMVALRRFSKTEPADVIENAFALQRSMGWANDSTIYCVDSDGLGQGVLSMLYRAGKQVHEFHSGGTANNPHMFKDAVSEGYFHLKKVSSKLPWHVKEDDQMFAQLTSRQYRYDNGKIRLESKDEYMLRVGMEEFTSPDRADATVLAFYPYARTRVSVAA